MAKLALSCLVLAACSRSSGPPPLDHRAVETFALTQGDTTIRLQIEIPAGFVHETARVQEIHWRRGDADHLISVALEAKPDNVQCPSGTEPAHESKRSVDPSGASHLRCDYASNSSAYAITYLPIPGHGDVDAYCHVSLFQRASHRDTPFSEELQQQADEICRSLRVAN